MTNGGGGEQVGRDKKCDTGESFKVETGAAFWSEKVETGAAF